MNGQGWPDGAPIEKTRNSRRAMWGVKRRAALFHFYKCCIWCGYQFRSSEDATIEHIYPRRFGGTNHPKNLALACGPCNSERGEWYNKIFGHRNASRVSLSP